MPQRSLQIARPYMDSASCNSAVRVWSFAKGREERILIRHGWDVKRVEWHVTMGLLVSGSEDNLIKFWDPAMEPRSQRCIRFILCPVLRRKHADTMFPIAINTRIRYKCLHGHHMEIYSQTHRGTRQREYLVYKQRVGRGANTVVASNVTHHGKEIGSSGRKTSVVSLSTGLNHK